MFLDSLEWLLDVMEVFLMIQKRFFDGGGHFFVS